MPVALGGGISGIGCDGNGLKGVAIWIGEGGRKEIGNGVTGWIAAVFCNGGQDRATAGDWCITDGSDVEGDGVGDGSVSTPEFEVPPSS